eukprot:91475-Pleurochrysis_carterae.AAC.1
MVPIVAVCTRHISATLSSDGATDTIAILRAAHRLVELQNAAGKAANSAQHLRCACKTTNFAPLQ